MYVVIGFMVFAAAVFIYEYFPRPRAWEFRRRYQRLVDDMRARGLSPEEQMQEMRFRTAWARLRRRASEKTIAWPEGHAEAISQIAAEEATALAVIDKDAARRFLKVVNGAPLGDILYPDASNAVFAEARAVARSSRAEVSDDLMTAVTRR